MSRLVLTIVAALAFAVPDASAARPTHRAQHLRLAQRVVTYARHQLGTPYRVGGASPGYGFDCSGLVYAAYRSIGRVLPRTTWAQLSLGRRVAWQSLRAGDLVFTNGGGHVVLVVSPQLAISAPRTGARVRVVPLSAYHSSFYAARRLL